MHFTRFAAFVRGTRIEATQPERGDLLTEMLGLEPGQDDGLVTADVLDRTRPALRRAQPVEVAALHDRPDLL